MAPYVDIRLALLLNLTIGALFLFVLVPLLAWMAWTLCRFVVRLFHAGMGPAGDHPESTWPGR